MSLPVLLKLTLLACLTVPETSKVASTTCRERAPWPETAVPGVELRGGALEGDDGREEGQALHRPQHAHGVVVIFRGKGTVVLAVPLKVLPYTRHGL